MSIKIMKPIISNKDESVVITRQQGGQPIQTVRVPISFLRATDYLSDNDAHSLLCSIYQYCDKGEVTMSPLHRHLIPLLLPIIEETEEAVTQMATASENARKAANTRWGSKDAVGLPIIDVPQIIVPQELGLSPIRRGGVDIAPEEYLRVCALFMLRGYRQGEHRAFYGYWAAKKWNDGAIDGAESRWNRAQRWQQVNGELRFTGDDAAQETIRRLFLLLPAELKTFLLSDGVSIRVDSTNHVCIAAPHSIIDWLSQCEAAKEILKRYAASHNAAEAEWGNIEIPFNLNNNVR